MNIKSKKRKEGFYEDYLQPVPSLAWQDFLLQEGNLSQEWTSPGKTWEGHGL